MCPRRQAGDPSAGFCSCGIPLAGPTKMHRVGLASVQLTRSTSAEAIAGRESLQPSALRARCTRKPTGRFGLRQGPFRAIVSQIATIALVPEFSMQLRSRMRAPSGMCSARVGGDPSTGIPRLLANKRKRTEGVAPSSDLPTDRRRSDCLSEGHQPQALRPRCTWDTTARFTPRQVGTDPRNPQFACFSLQAARDCVSPPVLYLKRTMKFAEPGALSSTSPADLPLPRTASREGFVLVASRARRSGNLRLAAGPCKGICRRKPRKLRTSEVR
jgi:hypothetical protein